MALFLTWRGLHLTPDLVNEGRNECEIRTCGLLGVLEVEAWGRRHSFKRIRNTPKTCNSGTFRELDEMEVFTLATGHKHLHNLVSQYFYT